GLGDGMALSLAFILVGTTLRGAEIQTAWAILALVWAAATVIGPVLAGTLTELVGWRVALLPVPILAIGFLVVGYSMPGSIARKDESAPKRPPIPRLVALAAGIAALSMAGESGSVTNTILLSLVALLTVAFAFIADRRAKHRLFPRRLVSARQPAALGI